MRPFFAAALLALAATAHPAAAAAGKKAALAPTVTPLSRDTVKKLKSGDPAQVKAALDDVRMSAKDGAAAVPAVADLLKEGMPEALTLAAIETLGDTENEGGSEVLGWYAHHRDPAVRKAAVTALARTRGAAAAKALRAALSDPDPGVRGISATGLGSLKAKDAVPDLFVALDHKVPEAAASIGQLCAGPECDQLAAKLGSVPFDVVTSGLDQVLFRDAKDVDDDLKVKIVGRIRELGTGESNRFLREVQGKWPATWSKRVKQAIDQAVLATASSPGAGPAPGGAP
ncbi:MAG: HEAT repeat domain-containing protein [Polyangiaceae bacterium]